MVAHRVVIHVTRYLVEFSHSNLHLKKTLVSLSSDKQVECVSFLMKHSQKCFCLFVCLFSLKKYFEAHMLTSMFAC